LDGLGLGFLGAEVSFSEFFVEGAFLFIDKNGLSVEELFVFL